MKFIYHSDPGHGWAKIPLKLIHDLCIMGEITGYSYIRGDHAFLEEDCDLTIFCAAMDTAGKAVTFKTEHTDKTSKIRSYERYSYNVAINNLIRRV